MKCPKCNGTGNIANGMWLCCECQGTGYIDSNEDWLQSLNTEQLAEFIYHITLSCYSCAQDKPWRKKVDERYPHCIFGKCTGKKEIVEWLKQPHHSKE